MEMNLQYFAEEAASAPVTGAPEGNEATESEQSSQEKQTPSEKTFTQSEVNEMIQKRVARAMKDKNSEIDNVLILLQLLELAVEPVEVHSPSFGPYSSWQA